MADVRVLGAAMAGGKIESLRVAFHGLPERTVDRSRALGWMRDGHSLIPVTGGVRRAALQLVEVGDDLYIRTDNVADAADRLPELPGV